MRNEIARAVDLVSDLGVAETTRLTVARLGCKRARFIIGEPPLPIQAAPDNIDDAVADEEGEVTVLVTRRGPGRRSSGCMSRRGWAT